MFCVLLCLTMFFILTLSCLQLSVVIRICYVFFAVLFFPLALANILCGCTALHKTTANRTLWVRRQNRGTPLILGKPRKHLLYSALLFVNKKFINKKLDSRFRSFYQFSFKFPRCFLDFPRESLRQSRPWHQLRVSYQEVECSESGGKRWKAETSLQTT